MNKRSMALLVIILFGSIPFPIQLVQAEETIRHPLDDAITLMYISDAILTDESEIDDSPESIGMLSPIQGVSLEVDTKPLLARIIHAKKMQRNDLDANCRLLKAYYIGQGKDCEAKEVNKYCQKTRAEINAKIGFYHKMRGDQRKFFTKMWHSIKRNSSNFWYKIGPLGRNILRNIGKEALQMAVTGGFGGGAIKNLVKHTAKSMGKERIKQVIYQGVQRLLQGQLDIAAAAGVDICEEDEQEEVITTEDKEEPGDCSSDRAWVDEFWDGAVVPTLVKDIKNCQPKAAWTYRSCLQEQAASGVCPEDAVEVCHAQYEAIPKNDSGGSVSLSPTIFHGAAESVSTSLIYPSEGGSVSGQFFYILKDNVSYCTITITSTITSGNFDLETCSMNGTAELTMLYEGIACPSVCGPETGACPKTFQGIVPWEATLEDSVLSGGVGGKACDPGCFGFRAGP